ncbi:MAG: ABC transporter substrate-binding protein [Alphaproteobacteria bacterium]
MSRKQNGKARSGSITRRSVLAAGGAGAAALTLTSPWGIGPRFGTRPAWAADLAPGMTGGPTGFPGAERYQYNAEMSEGRAVEAAKKLKADGKAPAKLTVLMVASCVPQFIKPLPAGGESVKETWERETGIPVDFVGIEAGEIWKKVLQEITTGSGSFDLYSHSWNNIGDLVSAGGAYNLDELVAKYQPDWGDKERGTPTPEIEQLLYKYNGSYYVASIDGDFVTWQVRRDLLEDATHRANFEAKFGYAIPDEPQTWAEVDNLCEYFHSQGIGHANLLGPFWGLSNFYARFAAQKAPNNHWLDGDGNPTLATPEGIKAAQEHIASLKWTSPDNLTWGWSEQYGAMANLKASMAMTYTNMASINDKMVDGAPSTPLTGKLTGWKPVGTKIGDSFIRRSVIYYNVTASVAAKSAAPEAAYLFLQYISSTRTFTRICGNPVGGCDPFQLANFADPYVEENNHAYMLTPIRETIRRACPTINFAGQAAMDNALDENLQAALTGDLSAEDALKRTEEAWKKLIGRREDEAVAAIRAGLAAWPTIVD